MILYALLASMDLDKKEKRKKKKKICYTNTRREDVVIVARGGKKKNNKFIYIFSSMVVFTFQITFYVKKYVNVFFLFFKNYF